MSSTGRTFAPDAASVPAVVCCKLPDAAEVTGLLVPEIRTHRRTHEANTATGRGTGLVQRSSKRWGVEPLDGSAGATGKVVVFGVPVTGDRRPSSADRDVDAQVLLAPSGDPPYAPGTQGGVARDGSPQLGEAV